MHGTYNIKTGSESFFLCKIQAGEHVQYTSDVKLRGRVDKFCLHLNRKWTGKDILIK